MSEQSAPLDPPPSLKCLTRPLQNLMMGRWPVPPLPESRNIRLFICGVSDGKDQVLGFLITQNLRYLVGSVQAPDFKNLYDFNHEFKIIAIHTKELGVLKHRRGKRQIMPTKSSTISNITEYIMYTYILYQMTFRIVRKAK